MPVMSTGKNSQETKVPPTVNRVIGFNEVVQIDHQKICMTATGYNQVLELIDIRNMRRQPPA